MMPAKRSAFFISDRTGITAEMLGHSLLTQFDSVAFNEVTLPFVNTVDKARVAIAQINNQGERDGVRPLVFSTLVRAEIAAVIATANALLLDCFDIFIRTMEQELGVQFGIRAANYPLIPEDFSSIQLPAQVKPLRPRLYGLTIKPERLQQIRDERRPGSAYATLANCEFEVREAEALMRQEGIPFLDATSKSVEELATTILQEASLVRRVY